MCSIRQNVPFPSVTYLGLRNHVRQRPGASKMRGKQIAAMSARPPGNLSLMVQGYRRTDLRNGAGSQLRKDVWLCPLRGRRPSSGPGTCLGGSLQGQAGESVVSRFAERAGGVSHTRGLSHVLEAGGAGGPAAPWGEAKGPIRATGAGVCPWVRALRHSPRERVWTFPKSPSTPARPVRGAGRFCPHVSWEQGPNYVHCMFE